MRITLIRHLQTEWNKRTLLQGKRNIELAPLSDKDRIEIYDNLHYLKKISPFDVVLASSLQRTQQTAQHYGYEASTEVLLDEFDFGPFEGVPQKKLTKKFGTEWIENPRNIVLGESMKNLEKRLITFLNKYNQLTNILVFGHGTWLRAFISYVTYGNINNMNKLKIHNNERITLSII